MPAVLISVQNPPCFIPMIPKSIRSALLKPSMSCFHYQKLDGIDFMVPVGDLSKSEIITNSTFLIAMTGVLLVVVALVNINLKPNKFKSD
jgi:hypothetical protein